MVPGALTIENGDAEVRPRISGIVGTFNEAANLPFSVGSLTWWCDEVLVVDMESTDATVEVAQRLGCRVLRAPNVGYVEPGRAAAIAVAIGDWILLLDADEVVPRSLARRLLEVAAADEADYVDIRSKTYMFGEVIRASGWGNDRHVRFFKRGHARTTDVIHNGVQPSGRPLVLPREDELSVAHFNNISVAQWLDKSNRYTTVEAENSFAGGARTTQMRAILTGLNAFRYHYVSNRGWRDGWRGLALALLMASYRSVAKLKLLELQENGSLESVRKKYDVIRSQLLIDNSKS